MISHPLASPPSTWVKVKCLGLFGSWADSLSEYLSGEALVHAQACAQRSGALYIGRYYNEYTEIGLVIVVEIKDDLSINHAAFAQTDLDDSHVIAMPAEFEPILARIAADTHNRIDYV